MDEKKESIIKLSMLVSEDDVEKAYEDLIKQAEIDDTVLADDVVLMWYPVQFKFTVGELLDQIL